MAINTNELKNISSILSAEVNSVLEVQYNKKRLRGEDYASVVAQSIVALIQTSVNFLDGEANRSEKARQFNLELEEKKRQFDLELESNRVIKVKQEELIEKQISTEISNKLLKDRQILAYDDKNRTSEAEMLSQIMGMFGAGGTALPTDLQTKTFDAVDKIS